MAGFATFKNAPTFDLQPEGLTITDFGSVVASLSSRRKFNAKDTSRLVLGNLSRNAEWLACKDAVSLSKLLCFSQNFEYRISSHRKAQRLNSPACAAFRAGPVE